MILDAPVTHVPDKDIHKANTFLWKIASDVEIGNYIQDLDLLYSQILSYHRILSTVMTFIVMNIIVILLQSIDLDCDLTNKF